MNKRKYIYYLIASCVLMACEQESLEPALNVADGGGTLSVYKAYSIDPLSGTSVEGRVVFWLDNGKNTLVQVSLNGTEEGERYPVEIIAGEMGGDGALLMSLANVDGTTGELENTKFYVIAGTSIFDGLDTYDAHIQIQLGADGQETVAAGNIGMNADPVAASD